MSPPPAAWLSFIARFPILHRCRLRWGELDAYQHLNNTAYFKLFEDARLAHFRAIVAALPPPLAPFGAGFLAGRGLGPILASTSCTFKAPLAFPDALVCGSSITAFAPDRFEMVYAIFSHARGVVAAEGAGNVRLFDYVAGRAARTAPPELFAAIAAVEARAAARGEGGAAALWEGEAALAALSEAQ